MIYYHGTTSDALPGIMRDGLRPDMLEKRWHIQFQDSQGYRPDQDDACCYTYLGKDWSYAKMYADGKANYLRAYPGSLFRLHGFSSTMYKSPDAPRIPNAEPIVLAVDWDGETEKDAKSWGGWMTSEWIPPEKIKVASEPPKLAENEARERLRKLLIEIMTEGRAA